jgi:hypothetical protein
MLQIVFEYLLRTDANSVCHPFLGTLEKKKNTKKWCIFYEQDKKSQDRLKFVPNGITQTARCTVCPANVFCKRSRKKSCKVPGKIIFKLYSYIHFHVLGIHCKRDSFL